MKNSRFSGFQWAMMVFVFFVITMALSVILRDFQATIGVKRFVFSIKDLAPFIAAIVCILVFKHRKEQLAGLKFSISLKVIERLLLALILPLIILMIGLFSFNTYADSFILLQTSDLSVYRYVKRASIDKEKFNSYTLINLTDKNSRGIYHVSTCAI